MDPNATLTAIRELVTQLAELDRRNDWALAEHAEQLGIELAEKVEALDLWIMQGGFLPAAWTPEGSSS